MTARILACLQSEADQQTHDVLERVGLFLETQHLPANPENYAFVYRFVTEPRSGFAEAVRQRIADGVRLTQADLRKLNMEHSDRVADKTPTRQTELRRLERLGRITAAVTRELGYLRERLSD